MERRLSDRAADERIRQLVEEGYLERIDIPKPNGTHLGVTKPSGAYLGLTTKALDLLT
jgi:CTP:molybdopterin cytidylyltransferase MocA